MYAKLTYLFLLSFAACLVTACSSDAPETPEVSEGAELSFAVSDVSRAAEEFPYKSFAVYGDMKFPVDGNTAPTVTFNKTLVEYKDNSWTYVGTQYWFPSHEHSFVAITPVSVLDAAGAAPGYSNSGLTFTYTLPTTGGFLNKDGATDILAATHRRLYNKVYVPDPNNIPDPVILKFQHILSRVNISLTLEDEAVKKTEFVRIHKIEWSGIRTKATFNILPASRQSNTQTDDNVIVVAGHEGDTRYTIDYGDNPIDLYNDKKVSLFDRPIIMLPQKFTGDSGTKIVVSYTVNGDMEAPKQLTILFNGIEWKAGNSYTCNAEFSIDKTEVKLIKVLITDWKSEDLNSEAGSD